MNFQFTPFNALDAPTLYTLLQARVNVFVVEQACPYAELDGRDIEPGTVHVLGYTQEELAAYTRILNVAEFTRYPASADITPIYIGRVLVVKHYRGKGYAKAALQASIEFARKPHPHRSIRLSAQVAALGLYRSLGFAPISQVYSEDGIDHIDMQLEPED